MTMLSKIPLSRLVSLKRFLNAALTYSIKCSAVSSLKSMPYPPPPPPPFHPPQLY